MTDTAESRAREALEWALGHTCLAIPHGIRTAAGWRWDADDAQLRVMTGDGDFRFHVAAERRGKLKVRIAVLSWEDDMGKATWEAEMPMALTSHPPQHPDEEHHPYEAGPEQPG